MRFEDLNKDNFLLFAIRNYDNPHAITKDDFVKDLNHFKYLKRLLRKYHLTGELKSHLLINHFIIIYNIFGDAATPMLFYKIEQDLWSTMKSFLVFLNKFPDYPKTSIHDIPVDIKCFKSLQDEYNGKRKD